MQSLWAFALMILLLGVLVSRFTGRLDQSWQLIVWGLVVVIANTYQGTLSPGVVYGGVIAALLLRFEFMGGWVLKLFGVIEGVAIGVLLWELFLMFRGY